jgi:uncharacterized protein DUF3105
LANKKKKRRSGSGSRPAGRTATPTRERRLQAESVRPAPATPGGPNRLERKELARKQREIIRRKIARRRFLRRGFRWLIAAVVVGVVVFLIVQSATPEKLNAEERRLVANAPAAATAAGCSGVQKVQPFDPESQDRTHLGAGGAAAMPPLSSYRTQPPASGPHNPTPLGAGQYSDPPPVDQTIHSLEHGAVIIWYDPSALSSQALTDLQTFFNKARERTKLIIAPYNYPDQGAAGKLPTGKQMVLVAWHRMQTCNKVSLPVAFQFVDHFNAGFSAGDYQGEAPEPSAGI